MERFVLCLSFYFNAQSVSDDFDTKNIASGYYYNVSAKDFFVK